MQWLWRDFWLVASFVLLSSCTQPISKEASANEIVEIARKAALERYWSFDFGNADVSIDNLGDRWLVGFFPSAQKDAREISGDVGIVVDKRTLKVLDSYYNK